MTKRIFNFQKGFTLVELMVAVSIFLLVATISIGAVLSIFDANSKSRTSKTVVDNLNLAMEDMTRTVRFGTTYHCGIGAPEDVDEVGDCNEGDWLSVNFKGQTHVYRLENGILKKSEDAGATYVNLTSSETTIDDLKFYVRGSSPSDNEQPYAIVLLRGHVGPRPTTQTSFTIETVMAQRNLDHGL